MNVNLQLVADGAASPYFFDGARGRYSNVLLQDAQAARASGIGLCGQCLGTALDPTHGVSTGASAG